MWKNFDWWIENKIAFQIVYSIQFYFTFFRLLYSTQDDDEAVAVESIHFQSDRFADQ